MRKIFSTILLLFLLQLSTNISTNSSYIEREEIPKELGLNVLEIYNYNGKILIFFDGYHQKGVIYLGDFIEIQSIYNFSNLDFILTKENTTNTKNLNFYKIGEITNLELQDDDNNIIIIDSNTLYFELKRFKFIISNDLVSIENLYKYDPQFLVIEKNTDLIKIQESFSVEQIFLVNKEFPPDINPIISVIPPNYFVQFICNNTSYKFQIKFY
jgi:hypothetical protein